MKEYICIKEFYTADKLFASVGDKVILLTDNSTVVNISCNPQKVAYNSRFIIDDTKYFVKIREEHAPKKVEEDNVNHPAWYTKHPSGIECIEITRHYCFAIGNAIKYLWRAGLKQEQGMNDKQKEIEDLQKAIWYINDRIKHLKNEV